MVLTRRAVPATTLPLIPPAPRTQDSRDGYRYPLPGSAYRHICATCGTEAIAQEVR